MAQVTLEVGGRRYDLACRDGEEAHLTRLATMVDRKAAEAARAVGGTNEARQLLLAALLLADQLDDAAAGARDPDEPAFAATIDALAERIERLAVQLENDAPTY